MATPLHYIITGGAGFIGSHLASRLVSRGHKVTVIDNLYTGSTENIKNCFKSPSFEFIKGDVCDVHDIKADKIYHLACPASPPAYMSEPLHTIETCTIGTMNILKLALKNNADVVFTSTSEIYGDPLEHPQPETYWGNVNCRGPRSCYDEGKRISETLCFEYLRKGVRVRTARLFNTYGPLMSKTDGRVVSTFINQALEGKDLTLMGDGNQTRSFTYVDDTVEALLRLMDVEYFDPVNIGNPEEFTIKEFAEIVLTKLKTTSKIVYLPAAKDDPRVRKPVIDVAMKILNWSPQTKLNAGLDETIKYFQSIF